MELDVRLQRVVAGVILVVTLRWIESSQRLEGGHDRLAVQLGGVPQLIDIRLGDTFLVFVGVEDGGAILPADVVALAVELGGVVGGKEDAQELAIGDDRRVVGDLDDLGVVGVAA